MKKTFVLCALSFLFTQISFGQESTSPLTKTWTLNFNVIGGSIIGEFPVTQKSTFKVEAGGVLLPLYSSRGDRDELDFEFGSRFNIYGALSYRQYYKIKPANKKNKSLFHNSGNYFFAQLAGTSPSFLNSSETFERDGGASIGLGWGLQRMYQNNFVFSFGIGGGYSLTSQKITPIMELTLGILLKPKAGKE